MLPILIFPYRHTPDADQFRRDVIAALNDAQIAHKEAAALMQLSEPVLSRQLNGEPSTHLSLWRLSALPEAFWNAFDRRRAERRGAVLLTPHLVMLLRGAANLKREVLKARLREPQKATGTK